MKKVSVFVSAALLLAVLAGCGASEKAQEKAVEKAIENAWGGDVSVNIEGDKYTYQDEEGNKMELGGTEWPTDDAAAFIPRFSKGSITATSLVANMYLIDVEKVEQADYDSYLQTLKGEGFTEQALTTEAEGYYQYQAGDTEGNYIMISYTSEEKTLQIMGTAAAQG